MFPLSQPKQLMCVWPSMLVHTPASVCCYMQASRLLPSMFSRLLHYMHIFAHLQFNMGLMARFIPGFKVPDMRPFTDVHKFISRMTGVGFQQVGNHKSSSLAHTLGGVNAQMPAAEGLLLAYYHVDGGPSQHGEGLVTATLMCWAACFASIFLTCHGLRCRQGLICFSTALSPLLMP